jgi:hypothetical protein
MFENAISSVSLSSTTATRSSESSYNLGASTAFKAASGAFARFLNDSMIENGSNTSEVAAKKNGKGKGAASTMSWFEAIAGVLGKQLGERVMKLMDARNRMEKNFEASTEPDKDPEGAKEYMKAQTDFQVQSQMFGMDSQVAATSIKSIGEGLSSVARKQ